MGLIIVNNTRSKRLAKILYDVAHSRMKLLYTPNFMFVDASVIEFREFNRKRRRRS